MTEETDQENGTTRLGVDFGVSHIVVAVCGIGTESHTLPLPGISREFPAAPGGMPVFAVPSLVAYEGGAPVRYGEMAASGGVAGDRFTARWLRQYLCENSPAQVPAGNGRMVGYGEAAGDLLSQVLSRSLRNHPGAGLVFVVPAGAPAEYPEFLRRIARAAGVVSCSFVSEFQAAAAGYGYSPMAGETFAMISFTETGPDITVISVDDRSAGPGNDRLKVLARAAGSTGLGAIDGWIAQDLLKKFHLLESDPRAVRLFPRLRYEASRLREHIPISGNQEVRLEDPASHRTFAAVYTAADLCRVLADHEVIPALQECIGRALSMLRFWGGDERTVRTVLLTGAGGALPAVRNAVQSCFPGALLCADRLLDAVARGAAECAAPARAPDRIMRSYALRYWDPLAQEHHYRILVRGGARFPSAGQVARVVITAAYDGQTLLGIPLYEIGNAGGDAEPQIELVADTGGGFRITGPAPEAGGEGQVVQVNEHSPTLLAATPPARKGEPRFECTFTIDDERNLCLSARDLITGTLVKVNTPVHRLI